MPDYREQALTGHKWTRSYRVHIENPWGGQALVTFFEEDISELSNGAKVNTPLGQITLAFTDPDTVVQLIDPSTGLEIPGATMTHGQLYLGLSSLYLQAAIARDAAANAPPEPEPEPEV
jgi:hypothetical protein